MRLRTLVLLTAGVAAGFAAARQLLADEGIPDTVPPEARARLERPRERLLGARARAKEALREARIERDAATESLTQRYHELTERDT